MCLGIKFSKIKEKSKEKDTIFSRINGNKLEE